MSNVSKDFCFRVAEARKAKGLRQTVLASQVGCTQSALSMFEGGQPTKLSDDSVKKLSELLGISLSDTKREVASPDVQMVYADLPVINGFCPNCQCPSNVPYVVGGRLFFRPSRTIASPNGGTRCTQCGEVLEMRCPKCGAPLNDGACCAVCGSNYVTPILQEDVDLIAYVQSRRAEIIQFRELGL